MKLAYWFIFAVFTLLIGYHVSFHLMFPFFFQLASTIIARQNATREVDCPAELTLHMDGCAGKLVFMYTYHAKLYYYGSN